MPDKPWQTLSILQWYNHVELPGTTLCVKLAYVEMTGDLAAGSILSQLLNWYFTQDDTYLVDRDAYRWVVIKRSAWWDIAGLRPKQVDQALFVLRQQELIFTKRYAVDNVPINHLRVNWWGFGRACTKMSARVDVVSEL